MRLKHALTYFVVALVITLLFTVVDAVVHSLEPDYAVPTRYFVNKMMYGTLLVFGALFILRKRKPWFVALTMSATVSFLLQVRYFIEGYPLAFVLEFFVWHFVMLLAISWSLLYLLKKLHVCPY